MTDDDIRAHVMKAEGALDQIQDKVTSQFGDARKAIIAIDRAYSQLLSSRDFYREARDELITERDHWEHQAKEARTNHKGTADRVTDLVRKLEKRMVEVRDLKAENTALRAGQGRWPDDKPDDFPCCSGELQEKVDQLSDAVRLANREKDEWESNYVELANSTPRVISAEDLRVGQVVAYDQLGFAGWVTVKISARNLDTMRAHTGDIVLLANAPAKSVDTSTPTVKESGESFTRPLTVHALNVAPVGSLVTWADGSSTPKGRDGTWDGFTAEQILHITDDATLTHPGGCGNE